MLHEAHTHWDKLQNAGAWVAKRMTREHPSAGFLPVRLRVWEAAGGQGVCDDAA